MATRSREEISNIKNIVDKMKNIKILRKSVKSQMTNTNKSIENI